MSNSSLTLVIGSRRYSTWSLRPWLMLKASGASFDTIEIPLRQPDTKARILEYSPSGKVPLLIDGPLKIWDSLAIAEYLAEKFPQARLWPENSADRAWARSVCAEMHSGFQTLRSLCPMDLTLDQPMPDPSPDLLADLHRIETIWTQCRQHHTAQGPFLFGHFSNADAMFAPVASRIATYHLPVNSTARDYTDCLMNLPWMREWTQQIS